MNKQRRKRDNYALRLKMLGSRTFNREEYNKHRDDLVANLQKAKKQFTANIIDTPRKTGSKSIQVTLLLKTKGFQINF